MEKESKIVENNSIEIYGGDAWSFVCKNSEQTNKQKKKIKLSLVKSVNIAIPFRFENTKNKHNLTQSETFVYTSFNSLIMR